MKAVVYQHPYAPDGVPDHKGRDRCSLCGLPRDRSVHELPPTEDDVRAMEARRVGEYERSQS